MKKYINARTGKIVETIEEMNSQDYPTLLDFKNAITTRIGSYRMVFKDSTVYASSRSTKDWSGN